MPTQPSTAGGSNPFSAGQLETLRQVALTLSLQGLQATPAVVHRDRSATTYAECPGCWLPSPIRFKYGGPMADCRLCGYGWAVEDHYPTHKDGR
ncbi:hypothetical protein BX286_3299 [Streptomyces sp. 3211.6]|uniref:hypothetical protein n=1 Tax=Streptomyces sp. 3211.6 TaxID=1938845 RepID=UPI000F1CA110|nr:hypothetical protein [Streptomyces sp. 3211.6]RKT05304.1 hypothetical protein BX286_3299 [Streptomyces sp. 3211.6]